MPVGVEGILGVIGGYSYTPVACLDSGLSVFLPTLNTDEDISMKCLLGDVFFLVSFLIIIGSWSRV